MAIPVTNNGIGIDFNEKGMSKSMKRLLLVLNCVMLGLGNCIGPQVQRLYFVKGGKRVWLSSCLETAGWPFLFIPIIISYLYRRNKGIPGTKLVSIRPALIIPCAVIGILTGADDYMYSYGVSLLPISTSALIIATQLAFTAGFAFLLVKQKFTSFTVNAVFLLCVGSVVLAFHTSSDRPANESNKQYFLGFFMTLGAAALYGFVLPAIELMCKKAKQPINYSLVMEMQVVMSFFATVVCAIGMVVNHDFTEISSEAREFELGITMYCLILILDTILWQLFFLGATGVIFCGSSLLSGIIIATLLPVTETLAVLFFHDKFQVEKAVSLILCLWGFVSYFYGKLQHTMNKKEASNLQLSQ
ncbi:putative purine permease [Heracleum sosnowskyi]|uniref:Probable purine permease n=1 Tax=Heracleum sosnowskyi TaxID=360622 RepID=A0AAD8IKA9_9APIA|nr:putative purine permease [Heracleum sosnowskyi]